MDLISTLRRILPDLDRLLGWPEFGNEYNTAIQVVAASSKRLASRRRGWRAYAGDLHPSRSIDFLAKSIGLTMIERFHVVDSKIGACGIPNEETTKIHLITPVLEMLEWHGQPDWHGLNYEYRLSNGGRPDAYSTGVAMEFKMADPKYDALDARNSSNKAYATVASQCTFYGEADEVNCLIFSNGRRWWRLEFDEDTNTRFAMRFDMLLAKNMFQNNLMRARLYNNGVPYCAYDLERFVTMFHSRAFTRGNNYAEKVHYGMHMVNYGEIGPIWLKDLNRGYGG